MSVIHFLNVLEGDCNIIQHYSKRISVIDVSNAYNDEDTPEEIAVKQSAERKEARTRTKVPEGKKNYYQKLTPDNPILYLRKFKIQDIFRFIITHPDMDHLDGIKDFYDEFNVAHTWDTNKNIPLNNFFAGYNKDDWKFYTNLRAGQITVTKRLTPLAGQSLQFWNQDFIKILSPTQKLVNTANEDNGDIHDASYVLLYTPPKKGGGNWRILFAGDSHDASWEHIFENYGAEVSNIDVLFAPHHGRGSNRDFTFLNTLKPRLTLLGNASSKHLDYSNHPKIRITNNQAGYVILDITEERILVMVKNQEFANDFKRHRGWSLPIKNTYYDAYPIFQFTA